MANYLDLIFSDPKLAKQMAAGPIDPIAFNNHLDTLAAANSPSMAQALNPSLVAPDVPVQDLSGAATTPATAPPAMAGAATTPATTPPAKAGAATTPPVAERTVSPAMLASILSATQKTPAQPSAAPAAPAAGRGYAPLQGGTGTQRFTAPGFFKALYPR